MWFCTLALLEKQKTKIYQIYPENIENRKQERKEKNFE